LTRAKAVNASPRPRTRRIASPSDVGSPSSRRAPPPRRELIPSKKPPRSPAVAEAGGDAVDAEVDAFFDALAFFAGAIALEELDLEVVEGVDVRDTALDGA